MEILGVIATSNDRHPNNESLLLMIDFIRVNGFDWTILGSNLLFDEIG